MNNLVEFFNNTIGEKPNPASISALDPNKKYCAYARLEAAAGLLREGMKLIHMILIFHYY